MDGRPRPLLFRSVTRNGLPAFQIAPKICSDIFYDEPRRLADESGTDGSCNGASRLFYWTAAICASRRAFRQRCTSIRRTNVKKSQRKVIVFATLLGVLALTSALLMALAPAPLV